MPRLELCGLGQAVNHLTQHVQRLVNTTPLLQPIPIDLLRSLRSSQIYKMEISNLCIHDTILSVFGLDLHREDGVTA